MEESTPLPLGTQRAQGSPLQQEPHRVSATHLDFKEQDLFSDRLEEVRNLIRRHKNRAGAMAQLVESTDCSS